MLDQPVCSLFYDTATDFFLLVIWALVSDTNVMDKASELVDLVSDLAVQWAPKVLLALATLIVGLWLVTRVANLAMRAARGRGVDETVVAFIGSLLGWTLRVLLLLSVASTVGIETTSFVAIFGAAGLAVGLALQGSLSNFAGGVLILVFKPFKVGDVIEAQGHVGSVTKIEIFTTTLNNAQNRRIIIPNGPLSNGTIVNLTVEETLRVDLVIGVAYGADIEQTRQVLTKVVSADERVLAEPAPTIEVLELADNSVNFAVRPHVKTADYWPTYFALMSNIKKALDEAKIEIPFPQRDVHIYNH